MFFSQVGDLRVAHNLPHPIWSYHDYLVFWLYCVHGDDRVSTHAHSVCHVVADGAWHGETGHFLFWKPDALRASEDTSCGVLRAMNTSSALQYPFSFHEIFRLLVYCQRGDCSLSHENGPAVAHICRIQSWAFEEDGTASGAWQRGYFGEAHIVMEFEESVSEHFAYVEDFFRLNSGLAC